MNFIYPAGQKHYAYWYYGVEPVIGTYTVTATYGSASKTASFTLADLTPVLDLPTQISATKLENNDVSITWDAVTGANSYYLSLWAEIWNSSSKQWDFTEVYGEWVNSNSKTIASGVLPSGLTCYAYVTAYQVNMASVTPPGTPPARADMSENYYGYQFPFLTP